MKTALIEVEPIEEVFERIKRVVKSGIPDKYARFSFPTTDLLWKVINPKRLEILQALCGAGEISIRETARRVGRDVKAVHGDCVALIKAGILERTSNKGVYFPYDAIKVEFMLKAA